MNRCLNCGAPSTYEQILFQAKFSEERARNALEAIREARRREVLEPPKDAMLKKTLRELGEVLKERNDLFELAKEMLPYVSIDYTPKAESLVHRAKSLGVAL